MHRTSSIMRADTFMSIPCYHSTHMDRTSHPFTNEKKVFSAHS